MLNKITRNITMMFVLLLSLFFQRCVSATVSQESHKFNIVTDKEKNDLNHVLQYIMSEMNEDNFFVQTWLKFYPTLPVPVPNNCYNGKKIDPANADESLKPVLESGIIRIGVSPIAALYPVIFSDLNTNGSTTTDVTSTTRSGSATSDKTEMIEGKDYSLELDASTLDGYEIVCSREAARRIGELYGIPMQAEFVVLSDESYFGVLRDALNNNTVDVVWTFMYTLDFRNDEVDFVCNSYSTEITVGASAKVGPERPSVNSATKIPVACYASFCFFQLPEPFYYVKIENGSNFDLMNVLAVPDDGLDYTVMNFEQLDMYYTKYCPDCSSVKMDPIAIAYMSPSTKYLPSNKTMTSDNGNNEDGTQGSSSAPFSVLRLMSTKIISALFVLGSVLVNVM